MSQSNNALRVTELDFDSIKDNLKTFLRERSGFTDFNYEGSNWSLVLDALAYNTHYMGYYVNAVANEMFLDTAQLRDSVLSHAKLMGYTPTSIRGAVAYVNIVVTPEPGEPDTGSLTLRKYTRLLSDTNDGTSYIFVVNESESASKANGVFTFSNVAIKQGDVVTKTAIFDTNTNDLRRFNIPSANIDTSTLIVQVQRSLTNTSTEYYTIADDITEVDADSPVFYLEENPESNGSYAIVFGDNYLGKQPANGSVVIMTYLDSVGRDANEIDSFAMLDGVGNFSANLRVDTVAASAGGAPKESINKIKFRAPLHYTTQNRAVTETDYETLILKDYPNIQAASVWGGQFNDPPIYGKVFISLLPRDGYYITTQEKQRIVNEIIATRSVVTVTPEIVDPEILYLLLNITVRYNPKLTRRGAKELKEMIREQVLTYKDENLIDFDDVFKPSILLRQIDNLDTAITGSDVKVKVQKRVELDANTTSTYTVDFGVSLAPGNIFNRITTHPAIYFDDREAIRREAYIEENANTLTGISTIKVTSGGRSYKTNPTVVISGDGLGATANATIVNGAVSKVTLITTGSGYSQANVDFSGGKGTGAAAVARLQMDRASLYSYYYSGSGRKIVLDDDVGYINYKQGLVVLQNITPMGVIENNVFNENYISVSAVPESSVVSSNRNRILSIDDNDSAAIQITLIPEE
jgi:hypothetical protein